MKGKTGYCWLLLAFALICCRGGRLDASAVINDTVKVGLSYGSSAVTSANAEYDDTTANCFAFGYYDAGRHFRALGTIEDETFVTVTSDPNMVLAGAAANPGGYRICTGGIVEPARGGLGYFSDTAVGVLDRNGGLLLLYDYGGMYSFALRAEGGSRSEPETWHKGRKYYGGFEYQRRPGGALTVCSVVDTEDYLRCVVPWEMSNAWPKEALKAQAVCARTYVMHASGRHSGFDVCSTTDCQAYYGIQTSGHGNSDAAVWATEGECIYWKGELIDAVYSASDGGATESSLNVWGTDHPYLTGKTDPYEESVAASISGYTYEVNYTADSLSSRLRSKGYSVGTVASVRVQNTEVGNVASVTVTDTAGKSVTIKGEKCRSAFGTKSQRFSFGDAATAEPTVCVNGSGTLRDTENIYLISGTGTVSTRSLTDGLTVMTNSGKQTLSSANGGGSSSAAGAFHIVGTGNGHNVGMSQWGANAMAKQGLSYMDILNFYYTGVTVQ